MSHGNDPAVRRRDILLAALASAAAPAARAQPARPLRLIVPFTPGGSTR